MNFDKTFDFVILLYKTQISDELFHSFTLIQISQSQIFLLIFSKNAK